MGYLEQINQLAAEIPVIEFANPLNKALARKAAAEKAYGAWAKGAEKGFPRPASSGTGKFPSPQEAQVRVDESRRIQGLQPPVNTSGFRTWKAGAEKGYVRPGPSDWFAPKAGPGPVLPKTAQPFDSKTTGSAAKTAPDWWTPDAAASAPKRTASTIPQQRAQWSEGLKKPGASPVPPPLPSSVPSPEVPTPPTSGPSTVPTAPTSDQWSRKKIWGVGLGGGALAGVGVGLVAGSMGNGRDERRRFSRMERLQQLAADIPVVKLERPR